MLDPAQVLAYALALGVAAAVPGPGMTALVARAAGSGGGAAFAMLGGLIVGDLIYLSFAVFGLALIASHFAALFVVIRWLSIGYLLWLAWSFWTAERHEAAAAASGSRGLLSAGISGLALTLGNPKTIAFYLALLPLVIDLGSVGTGVWATVLVPLTVAILAAVGAVFIVAALGVRRLLASAAAQRRLHRGAALAMAGAAGTMIVREV